MSQLNPVLWIDGEPTSVLVPVQGAKRVYWALGTAQQRKYGANYGADVFPNGLNTTFSIGTDDNPGVNIAMSADDKDATIIRGEVVFPWGGENKVGRVMLHELADGTFQFKPGANKKPEPKAPVKKTLTREAVFTVKR